MPPVDARSGDSENSSGSGGMGSTSGGHVEPPPAIPGIPTPSPAILRRAHVIELLGDHDYEDFVSAVPKGIGVFKHKTDETRFVRASMDYLLAMPDAQFDALRTAYRYLPKRAIHITSGVSPATPATSLFTHGLAQAAGGAGDSGASSANAGVITFMPSEFPLYEKLQPPGACCCGDWNDHMKVIVPCKRPAVVGAAHGQCDAHHAASASGRPAIVISAANIEKVVRPTEAGIRTLQAAGQLSAGASSGFMLAPSSIIGSAPLKVMEDMVPSKATMGLGSLHFGVGGENTYHVLDQLNIHASANGMSVPAFLTTSSTCKS